MPIFMPCNWAMQRLQSFEAGEIAWIEHDFRAAERRWKTPGKVTLTGLGIQYLNLCTG
jgi:hypothetical protein